MLMNVKTYAKQMYRECPIYYRNLGTHFEYLAIINGELYEAHVDVRPHWVTRLLYWIKLEKTPYSDQQQKGILKMLRILAESTIDYVLKTK